MSTILLCKSENNNNNLLQSSNIEPETIRLKREEGGGGSLLIQAMAQPHQVMAQQPNESRLIDHDEKKMRRQIANSNERRRMQSINAGFQSLRQLLPHHEGEKLSKAAILQQTAEYIDRLELEKQQLVAQNQHLQRLVDSLGGGNNNNNNSDSTQQAITSTSLGGTAIKKRKLDQVMTVQTISDSSDEGLGSMSPEPVSQMIFSNGSSTITKTHLVSATTTTINVKDYVNLQNQMETERRHRIQLEEQLKQLETQFYSSHQTSPQKYHDLQNHDEANDFDGQQQQVEAIVEEKIILRQASQDDIHYISTVQHHPQFVIVSTNTPGSSPKHAILNDDDDNSRTLSSDELNKDEIKTVRQNMSPKHREVRIPSILEQAIKAEPKVEVERINSPCIQINMVDDSVQSPLRSTSPAHIRTTYPNNNQRPNLETIVEAIRHLEGDAFDSGMDDAQETKLSTQEVPLALTTNKYQTDAKDCQQPFLKFRQSSTSTQSGLPTFSLSVPSSQQQYQRPGVIVVKSNS